MSVNYNGWIIYESVENYLEKVAILLVRAFKNIFQR